MDDVCKQCGVGPEYFEEYDGSMVCSNCGLLIEQLAVAAEDEYTGRSQMADRLAQGELDFSYVERRVERLGNALNLDEDSVNASKRFARQMSGPEYESRGPPQTGVKLENIAACAVLLATRSDASCRAVLTLREVASRVTCKLAVVGQRWLRVIRQLNLRQALRPEVRLQPSQLLDRYGDTLRAALLKETPPLEQAAAMLGPNGAVLILSRTLLVLAQVRWSFLRL